MSFGKDLKQKRGDMSYRGLGEKSGIDHKMIFKYEHNPDTANSITLRNAVKLSSALKWRIKDMIESLGL